MAEAVSAVNRRNALVRQMRKNGYSNVFIAVRLGISPARVQQIVSGKQGTVRSEEFMRAVMRERAMIKRVIDEDFDTRGDR